MRQKGKQSCYCGPLFFSKKEVPNLIFPHAVKKTFEKNGRIFLRAPSSAALKKTFEMKGDTYLGMLELKSPRAFVGKWVWKVNWPK